MNLAKGKDNINRIIDGIVRQTQRIFGVSISEEQLQEFAYYLEWDLLKKIQSAQTDVIYYLKPGETDETLGLALMASGISKDGSLPQGEYYRKILVGIDAETRKYAEERMGVLTAFNFFQRVCNLDLERKKRIDKFPDMLELVDLLIIANEQLCNQVDVYNGDVATGMLAGNYFKCMGFFNQYGIDKNLACDICTQLYDGFSNPRHYEPITREALKGMANIDMLATICGNGAINLDYLEVILQRINAAKLEDPELIEPLARRFKEVITPIIEGTNLKVYSLEEQARRFTYVGNRVNLIQPKF